MDSSGSEQCLLLACSEHGHADLAVLHDSMPLSFVECYQNFAGLSCHNLHTLKMDVLFSFETSLYMPTD
jgi:hypothetical protein